MGWILSLLIALCIGGILQVSGLVISFIFIGLAMSTTAVGVLVPILRDEGELKSNFGRFVFSAGVLGEFAPLTILAIFFNPVHNNFSSILIVISSYYNSFINIIRCKTLATPIHRYFNEKNDEQ